ncbi:MAG: hypothetical protein ACTSYA_09765 [Candidatus Kariarchaeaceae archaeon]
MEKMAILLKIIDIAGEITGRTRIQKIVFLTSQMMELEEAYDFHPHLFGPYSNILARDLQKLVNWKYVNETRGSFDHTVAGSLSTFHYTLSNEGEKFLEELTLPIVLESCIDELVSEFKNVPLNQLLRYVYENHPAFASRSLIDAKVRAH